VALHRDLLALRRTDPAFAVQRTPAGRSLGPAALVLRFGGARRLDRLLLLNLGSDLTLDGEAEALLAAPDGADWTLAWSSEDPRYGGGGTPASASAGRLIPAESALVFVARRRS
jgi:maltooligosyltrehalose trehalohydrolase